MRVLPQLGHSMPGINAPNINPQWGQKDETSPKSSTTISNRRNGNRKIIPSFLTL